MNIIQDSPNNYVNINSIVNNITKQIATRLYVSSIYDNLSNTAVFNCVLTDDNKNNLYNTQIQMCDIDYVNWDGDNSYPFLYTSNKLNLNVI